MPTLEQPREVLQRFALGEIDAFEELFRRHQSEVYRWILRIVRDPAIAEDLTVETFWRIHRSHARFDPGRSFEAWARRIASNAALDHLRSSPCEVALPEHFSDRQLPQQALPNPGISLELRQKTARAFARLPPKLRIAATLALIEEQPYKEIAEALGISTGAVKLRVFRALRLLRKTLQRQGIEP
ncbi:MAG TPA: RNA polymerase sigma factor [Candidatus Sulfotelmatobacter sp.]